MIRRRDTGPLRVVPPIAPVMPPSPGSSVSEQEFAAARAAVRRAPETRAERVADLRQRIAAGTYHVSDAELARCLMMRHA